LPAAELAITVHPARRHTDIDVSYGQTPAPIARRHALAVAGPVRETYLIGPRDTGDAASLARRGRLASLPHLRTLTKSSIHVRHGRSKIMM